MIWLYQSGSKYETPFWEHARSLQFDDNLFNALINICSSNSMESVWSLMDEQEVPEQYGQWDLSSIRNWIQNTK